MSRNSANETVSQHARAALPPPVSLLQRRCACGQHTIGGGQCGSRGKKNLQRQSRKRLKHVTPFKEFKFGVGFGTQITGMEPHVVTKALREYTLNIVTFAMANKKETFEAELGVSGVGKIEGPGEAVGHQHGVEIAPALKAKPRIGRGQWYLFLELPVRFTATFEGLHFEGGSVSFTPFLGTGVSF